MLSLGGGVKDTRVGQETPEMLQPAATWHGWGGYHFDEQVCGREMVEKEKRGGLCTVKRGKTENEGGEEQSDVSSLHCLLRPWRCSGLC